VTFNEITKKAVQEAFNHARDVDQNLVDAAADAAGAGQAVGYQISPLLWDKVRRGLSAGRVQTVAVRLIVEREREIGAFSAGGVLDSRRDATPGKTGGEELQGSLCGHRRRAGQGFRTAQIRTGRRCGSRNALAGKAAMDETLAALEKAKWTLATVQATEKQRRPLPPFITSQLQRDASNKLGFNVRRTMGVGAATL